MQALKLIFIAIGHLLNIYSLLCCVRIILTWIPGVNNSSFGLKIHGILATICDPFLNLFRNIRWLKFGSIDFSPALALLVLELGSTFFISLGHAVKITLGGILSGLIGILWNIVLSILIFLFLLVLVRFILDLVLSKDKEHYFINLLDRSISPMILKICGIFVKKSVSYRTALIVNDIIYLVIIVLGSTLFGFLQQLAGRIPF